MSHLTNQQTEATWYVTATGVRADDWLEIFGTNQLPVLSDLPVKVMIEGMGEIIAFMLDVSRLTEEQFDHMCLHLSICFRTTPAEIGHDMRTRGMPLIVDANLLPPVISMRMVI